MKKYFGILFSSIFLFAAAPALALSFSSFDQKISVGPTGMLTVTETAKVEFSDARHGIYRDIPVRYTTDAGNPFSLRVKISSVTDENGALLRYSTSRSGDDLRVKIGDPDALVTGPHTYIVTYTVDRALLYMTDHDELYWNVVVAAWGDMGWPDKVSAEISLPGQVAAKDLQRRCFTGLGIGAPEDCAKSAGQSGAQFSVEGGRPLTIVVGWPKGVVAKPAPVTEIMAWLEDNWIVALPIIAFVALFLLWYKKGRDPKPQGPLVVQYEPPDGAAPAEVGVLFDQKANRQEITATIVHLAVKGYLNVIESPEKGLLGSKRAYSFEFKKSINDASLAGYEREILNGIFGVDAGAGARVELSELENKFYKAAAASKKKMADATVERGWFAKNPTTVRAAYMGVGGVYAMIVFWLLSGLLGGPVAWVSLLLPAAFLLFFGYFMPARTVRGTEAYARALGFKEYLSKAETYRLRWEEKENIFEKFLPYAMIYGVVDKWAKAFEGMEMRPPSWYQGSTMNAWTPLMFAHTLNSATASIGHALLTAPSSHGGGGFGGGGGGGGGFGGGGGGSW